MRSTVISERPQPLQTTSNTRLNSSGKSVRSEEHTSELQSRPHLVCRLLLEKKKKHCMRYFLCLNKYLPIYTKRAILYLVYACCLITHRATDMIIFIVSQRVSERSSWCRRVV